MATPREYLTSARWHTGGAYTCMRVTGEHIHLWEFHYRRLGVLDSQVEGLHKQIVDGVRSHAPSDSTATWMVTVLCADNSFLIHVYKMPGLRLDDKGDVLPIDVLVHGAPRARAHVKHVQWIQDRVPIEEYARSFATSVGLNEPFGEVILQRRTTTNADTTPRTELLEGLITNFFVWRQGTLFTAADHDDILHGSSRHLVLNACRRLHIPVQFTAPCWEESATWDAAFVTSKS
ncbi:hypothetical protein DYB36_009256 [Aphanomyces astaci]|uniref:Uncharacterized protein n=1 Tax=Aphanomyces astaci TaxID=112090 RepID=A0A397B0Q3_APHAT|nr:hypothetical protein DYB36_009256 [Aphanomyces astaci]